MAKDDRFGRTELLVGADGLQRLAEATVAVFGLGGVGSYAVEAIARAGVGHILLVDFDVVEVSNLNRQLFALGNTLGQPKVEIAKARIREINPAACVDARQSFAGPDNLDDLLPPGLGYAIDAIDSVAAKVHLLATLRQRGIFAVSCMGAANKLSPTGIRVEDIGRTRACPLARVVRQRLRKLGITNGIPCVYSEENLGAVESVPDADTEDSGEKTWRKTRVQGSISYVPGIIGLTAAGVVINEILDRGESSI
jgi:tRNA A37 threonylcarbamoyladenosine dehydratase